MVPMRPDGPVLGREMRGFVARLGLEARLSIPALLILLVSFSRPAFGINSLGGLGSRGRGVNSGVHRDSLPLKPIAEPFELSLKVLERTHSVVDSVV